MRTSCPDLKSLLNIFRFAPGEVRKVLDGNG
ncbi:hypothetical protein C7402_1469 [Paraburkholderia unamae]|uniref:Uncharacterized protein n=1 Tax=Paraburkholderia unamae TaxID=219649 RepID=A0ABX5K671_9BURK|nr:hypothetical protein C7402_1469 [Paraburkholderia unamae]RAR56379.1 hypothetical protein C7401_11928 [Paraburkholderia unamae]CAG9266252.1 hypothetical protein PUN4_510060 [Paraburkholderia unamae]